MSVDRRDSLKWNFRKSVGSLVIDDTESSSLSSLFMSPEFPDSIQRSNSSAGSPALHDNHDEIEIRSLQAKLDEARQTIQILLQTKNSQELLITQLKEDNRKLRESAAAVPVRKEGPFLNSMTSSSTSGLSPEFPLNNKQFKYGTENVGIPLHHGIQLEHGDEDEDEEEQYSAVSEDDYGLGLDKHFGSGFSPLKKSVSSSICRHFLKGRCRYKASCRFSHEVEKCPYCQEVLPISKVSASAHLGRCWKVVEQQEAAGAGKSLYDVDVHDHDDHSARQGFLYLHKDR